MNFKVFFRGLGLTVGILAGLATVIACFHEINKPSSKLSAYISSGIFYTPPQFNKKIVELYKKIDFSDIYDSVDKIAKDATFEEKKQVTDILMTSMKIPFSTPFENGLQEYRKLIFVSINNAGDALAKDIYIDYPEKVLLMIQDDKGDFPKKPELISRYKIESIRQGGHYRIWAWAKNEEFDKYQIKIGSDTQVADMNFGEMYYGKTASIASFIENNINALIFLLAITIFYCIYSIFLLISSLQD